MTIICLLPLLSQALSSTERRLTFISGGRALDDPQLGLLNPPMNEINFDKMGFSVPEVNVLLYYLSLQNHDLQGSGFAENDPQIYSLLLRFAKSVSSQNLFEFIARDFYYFYESCIDTIIQRVPVLRSELFESILFGVFLDLSSNLDLGKRVGIFSSLVNNVRPHFYSFGNFLLSFDYKVLNVILKEDLKVTEWTLEIQGRLQTTFQIGNYNSEEWDLRFVDGYPQLVLAQFIAKNAESLGRSKLAFLFSALENRYSISAESRATALRIAKDYQFADAIKSLKESRIEHISRSDSNESNEGNTSLQTNRKRKRNNDQTRNPVTKKRRIEPVSYKSVTIFKLRSKKANSVVTVQEGNSRLLKYFQRKFGSFNYQKGKLEFNAKIGTKTKLISLPDLTWEAVKSFDEVIKHGLGNDDGPPNTMNYPLDSIAPSSRSLQKELMLEVAQMVCVSIRFHFDEKKFFTLLDWYKERMEGVWEELVQSGNKFVEEVEEARDQLFGTLSPSVEFKDKIIQSTEEGKVQFSPYIGHQENTWHSAVQYSQNQVIVPLNNICSKPKRNSMFDNFWELDFKPFDDE